MPRVPLPERVRTRSSLGLRTRPLLTDTDPSDAPDPTPGIHSRLVKILTRSGSFAFLSDLFATDRLFELRDFHSVRVMSKVESIEQFVTSMNLVLDLTDKYPRVT
jgi:hypothetical protein